MAIHSFYCSIRRFCRTSDGLPECSSSPLRIFELARIIPSYREQVTLGDPMDSEFRELTSRERGLLEKLLNAAIHGGDELRTQLNHVKAKQIEEDGTLRLQCDGGIPAPGKYAPVAEGICKDADGSDIAVILHLGKGGSCPCLRSSRMTGRA